MTEVLQRKGKERDNNQIHCGWTLFSSLLNKLNVKKNEIFEYGLSI